MKPQWEAKEMQNFSPKTACALAGKIELGRGQKCNMGGTNQKCWSDSEKGEKCGLNTQVRPQGRRAVSHLKLKGEQD